jgi:urease accessory protein
MFQSSRDGAPETLTRRPSIGTTLPLAAGLAVAATPALAHLNAVAHGSFVAGLSHPFLGIDHVLAMIAVGLWGALLGGPARWALPTAFVGAMVTGFALLLLGVPLPLVDAVVPASVLILGLAVVLMVRLPVTVAAAVTGALGAFHGHEHGSALGSAGGWAYASGFVTAAALLQACGLVIAWGFAHGLHHAWLARGIGGAAALGGLSMVMDG